MESPERRWATADRLIGRSLLVVACGCVVAGLLELAGLKSHAPAPLDSAVLPVVFAIVPAGVGGLFLLAELAMRQRTDARWYVQGGAIVAPVLLGALVWLSW
jgi:hypothetical protein